MFLGDKKKCIECKNKTIAENFLFVLFGNKLCGWLAHENMTRIDTPMNNFALTVLEYIRCKWLESIKLCHVDFRSVIPSACCLPFLVFFSWSVFRRFHAVCFTLCTFCTPPQKLARMYYVLSSEKCLSVHLSIPWQFKDDSLRADQKLLFQYCTVVQEVMFLAKSDM